MASSSLGSLIRERSGGYPVISHFLSLKPTTLGAHNIGGINATGQVPQISNDFGLIDPDTPSSALSYTTFKDKSSWSLVFSDEFNVENRSFYAVSAVTPQLV